MLADVGGVTVTGVRLPMGAATRAGTWLGDLPAAGDAVLAPAIRSAMPAGSSSAAGSGAPSRGTSRDATATGTTWAASSANGSSSSGR